MTATADSPPVDRRVTDYTRAVTAVLAATNGDRDQAVKRLTWACDALTKRAPAGPELRDLEEFTRRVLAGQCTAVDPATHAAWLALQIADRPRSELESSSLVDRMRARLMTAADVEALPPPAYVLDRFIVENSLGVIYGKPSSGKSLAMLDMAASIATGSWWFRHEVRKGPVLYVAAEGLAGLGKRLRAWKAARHMYDVPGLIFYPAPVGLTNLLEVTAFCTVAAELDPVLIVVDTLGRSVTGADENSAKDMGIVVEHLDSIRTATSAAVWAVHHDTKAGGTMRGSSVLEGAADTVIEAKRNDDDVLTLTTTKQKDDRKRAPLRLHIVESDGSVVLADRPTGCEPDVTDQARIVLGALADAALADGLSATTWLELAVDQGVSRSAFFKHRKTLVSTGLVHEDKSSGRPRYTPAPVSDPTGDGLDPDDYEEF